MLREIIVGFQTGADEGGACFAIDHELALSGWMPYNYATEIGPKPEWAQFGAMPLSADWAKRSLAEQYAHRTALNVMLADAVLIFGDCNSPGSKLTLRLAKAAGKATLIGLDEYAWTIMQKQVEAKIVNYFANYSRVMIAGNRESKCPGICALTQELLTSAYTRHTLI